MFSRTPKSELLNGKLSRSSALRTAKRKENTFRKKMLLSIDRAVLMGFGAPSESCQANHKEDAQDRGTRHAPQNHSTGFPDSSRSTIPAHPKSTIADAKTRKNRLEPARMLPPQQGKSTAAQTKAHIVGWSKSRPTTYPSPLRSRSRPANRRPIASNAQPNKLPRRKPLLNLENGVVTRCFAPNDDCQRRGNMGVRTRQDANPAPAA